MSSEIDDNNTISDDQIVDNVSKILHISLGNMGMPPIILREWKDLLIKVKR